MIAYKNIMNELNHSKEPKPMIEKKHCITKYPLHKVCNSHNKIIPFPKHKMNYLVDNPKNFIRKYNENKVAANYTNNIDKLYSLDIKLKSEDDKPPDYYQYDMKNKTIEDLRLDAYQDENNIKSNMTILQEKNIINKSLNEINTDEDDFQTNLNIILNEYKNKQKDLNLREVEPTDNELNFKTNIINNKLERLKTDHNKLPIVFKTYTKQIKPIEPDKLSKEEIDQYIRNNVIFELEPVQTTATYKTNDNNIKTATDATRTEFGNDELYLVIDGICSINKYDDKITKSEKQSINKRAVENNLNVLGPKLVNKKSVIVCVKKEIAAKIEKEKLEELNTKNQGIEELKKLMTEIE